MRAGAIVGGDGIQWCMEEDSEQFPSYPDHHFTQGMG